MSSPERWEIKQLIASGAVNASEYPDINKDFSNLTAVVEVEEDVDIEVREDEPVFLASQTKSTLHLSPVKIIQAPNREISKLSIQDHRKSLPIYKLRDPLLQAIADVCGSFMSLLYFTYTFPTASSSCCRWRYWFWQDNSDGAVSH
jgi:hypothetical protein